MPRYDAEWVGLDPGREGLWEGDKWLRVLQIIADHEGEDVYSFDSAVYADLEAEFPEDKWMSDDRGAPRPIFRDYNPWTRTGTIDLEDHTFRVTALGRQVLSGELIRASVIQSVVTAREEAGENPFRVISRAFLEAEQPLGIDELYFGVVKNYRPGDDFDEALLLGEEEADEVPPTPRRRLRHMMSLLEETGAIVNVEPGLWVTGDEEVLRRIAAGTSPEEPVEPVIEPTVGSPYKASPEEEADKPEREPTFIDPDTLGEARKRHNATQNQLAGDIEGAGYDPLSPTLPLDPPFDLAYEVDGSLFVVEVKSLSDSNEAHQIRLGIGQVLDYRYQFRRRGIDARPILAVERKPRDDRWAALCDYLEISLIWPTAGSFPVPSP